MLTVYGSNGANLRIIYLYGLALIVHILMGCDIFTLILNRFKGYNALAVKLAGVNCKVQVYSTLGLHRSKFGCGRNGIAVCIQQILASIFNHQSTLDRILLTGDQIGVRNSINQLHRGERICYLVAISSRHSCTNFREMHSLTFVRQIGMDRNRLLLILKIFKSNHTLAGYKRTVKLKGQLYRSVGSFRRELRGR